MSVVRRELPFPGDENALDAAEYEAVPGKLLCIVRPEGAWQKSAAAWIDMAQLNLRIERHPCRIDDD